MTYCYDGRTWTGTDLQCTGNRAAPFYGRLTEQASSISSMKYTNYDNLGRVTASTQTTPSQSSSAYPFPYTYNAAGMLTGEQYPSGRWVKFGYDAGGSSGWRASWHRR